MEKHCVSLELAKQLKEAGWKKRVKSWWIKQSNGKYQLWVGSYIVKDKYPAPLATEILEELPREISIKQYPESDSVRYQVGHNTDKMGLQTFRYSNSLCDALAEMWLYLRKEKII
jgi:hypothetical protein